MIFNLSNRAQSTLNSQTLSLISVAVSQYSFGNVDMGTKILFLRPEEFRCLQNCQSILLRDVRTQRDIFRLVLRIYIIFLGIHHIQFYWVKYFQSAAFGNYLRVNDANVGLADMKSVKVKNNMLCTSLRLVAGDGVKMCYLDYPRLLNLDFVKWFLINTRYTITT